MVEKEIICITCPAGCRIKVKSENGEIVEISGHTCKRGEEYARNEFLDPRRTLTSVVKANGYTCPVISVRSSEPIPKDKMLEAMDVIRKTEAEPPFYVGKVVISDILGTGADIILSNQ
ncbi:MAG: DUF1667 domain-containing protein [Anaerovoracaceae bacterium]|jgi:CxxC motif-containing protein